MHTPDLYSEFLSQVLGQAPPAAGPAATPVSTEELSEMATEAAAQQGRSQAARLSPAERERLSGKRPPLLPELLVQCAEILEEETDFAQEFSVPAAIVDKTARQDAAVGRLAQVSGEAYEAAGEAAAQIAEDAGALGEQALAAAEHRAETHPGERSRIRGAFADARRFYGEAQGRAGKQKTKKDRKLRGGREALGKLKEETAELRLLHQMLDGGTPDA